MAFILIDRVAMPELASMDALHIAALMLKRAPLPADVIVEIIDPTVPEAAPPVRIAPVMPRKRAKG